VTTARVVTVGADYAGAADDAAGRDVARAVVAEGLPVAARAVVDEDEGALEALLRAPDASVRLTVLLARPGGSAGEVVRRVLARIAGARLVLSDRLLDLLEADFARAGRAMPRRQERLALVPQGAQIWAAPAGEPGWAVDTPHGLVAVLPLGSSHLAHLVDAHLRPAARDASGPGGSVVARTLKTVGLPAADCEERLAAWLGREGDVQVACVPADGEIWVRLLARGASRPVAEAAVAGAETAIRAALGTDCFGADDDTLEVVVGRVLVARGLRVAVAESFTGGLLASRLSRSAGASAYFDHAVVAYSNKAKADLLGVPEALLRLHGAVSAPVTERMAAAARLAGPATCGLGVTGVAGPGGGSPDKPVGTAFVAAATPSRAEVRRLHLSGGRDAIRWQACQAALDLLRRMLLA
jgi:nicotinamide-nucleotide amidase